MRNARLNGRAGPEPSRNIREQLRRGVHVVTNGNPAPRARHEHGHGIALHHIQRMIEAVQIAPDDALRVAVLDMVIGPVAKRHVREVREALVSGNVVLAARVCPGDENSHLGARDGELGVVEAVRVPKGDLRVKAGFDLSVCPVIEGHVEEVMPERQDVKTPSCVGNVSALLQHRNVRSPSVCLVVRHLYRSGRRGEIDQHEPIFTVRHQRQAAHSRHRLGPSERVEIPNLDRL